MSVKRDAKRGTWTFVVDVATADGKRQQMLRRGFRTKKAAEAAEAAVIADQARGTFVRPTRVTLSDYLTGWLEARAIDLRPSTLYGYRKVVEARIIPGIGQVKLSELDAATLEAWYGRLLVAGGNDGGGLSAKTVANTAGVLSVALADAVRLKLLRHNPASEARLPRRERREMAAWTEQEASDFLAAVAEERLYPLWRLVLASGLRRGELCGLRWRDVDLVRRKRRGRAGTCRRRRGCDWGAEDEGRCPRARPRRRHRCGARRVAQASGRPSGSLRARRGSITGSCSSTSSASHRTPKR